MSGVEWLRQKSEWQHIPGTTTTPTTHNSPKGIEKIVCPLAGHVIPEVDFLNITPHEAGKGNEKEERQK